VLPNKALSNTDLTQYAKCLKIPYFRGVFMKDELPRTIKQYETGIVNLDNSYGPGTHWVCYKKVDNVVYYFDSFGNIPPPQELINYFRPALKVFYNYSREQPHNTSICGHLCLEFLRRPVSLM